MNKSAPHCDECSKEAKLFKYGALKLCEDCLHYFQIREEQEKELVMDKDYPDTLRKDIEQKEEEKSRKRNKDYSDILVEAVKDNDMYDGILKNLPKFYVLLCNIASYRKSNWYTKMLVNSALAYLVIEEDVIPDKKGPKGHLDDLFICTYVLKLIRDKISKDIISDNLHGTGIENGEQAFDLIYETFSKSSFHLEERAEEILSLVGLNKFNNFDLMYQSDKNIQLTKYKKKKRLIYAMLAVKTKQVMSITHGSIRLEHLKKHIKEHPEFIEIKRFMGFNN